MNTIEIAQDCVKQLNEWYYAYGQFKTYANNTEISNDCLYLYLRYGSKSINRQEIKRCLTIANVTVYESYQNKGIFKEVISCFKELEYVDYLILESVLNPHLIQWAYKENWIPFTYDSSIESYHVDYFWKDVRN